MRGRLACQASSLGAGRSIRYISKRSCPLDADVSHFGSVLHWPTSSTAVRAQPFLSRSPTSSRHPRAFQQPPATNHCVPRERRTCVTSSPSSSSSSFSYDDDDDDDNDDEKLLPPPRHALPKRTSAFAVNPQPPEVIIGVETSRPMNRSLAANEQAKLTAPPSPAKRSRARARESYTWDLYIPVAAASVMPSCKRCSL